MAHQQSDQAGTVRTYYIDVTRRAHSGTLKFKNGNVSVNTTCWWDPNVVIDSGVYRGYATRMATKNDGRRGKKREGIWFGKGVRVNHGSRKSNEIFIHKGTNPSWSDGCVVIRKDLLEKIWDSIDPKEKRNVVIRIYNQPKAPNDRHCTRR